MEATGNTLLIVERAHRGSVESQFADTLYFVQALHRQSGGVDLVLRGAAAGYAVETDYEPALHIGGRTLRTLPDPRRSVRELLAEGVGVWVEEPDLSALGAGASERLIPGVRRTGEHEPASLWSFYERVWFF
ncbi:hypothetical protein ABZ545_06375 [Streptomyces abikoensis]|uniref:hypothetical protein n=1 Tax=Streptomyces abikoensis TaxID=97398 RepID=UPI0034078001